MAEEKTATPDITDAATSALAEMQKAGMGSFVQMNARWIETMGDMGAEVLSFLADRIKEDVKTQHELLHCKDVDEARRIQQRFVQKAIDQYQAETGKLVEMGMSAFQTGDGKSSS